MLRVWGESDTWPCDQKMWGRICALSSPDTGTTYSSGLPVEKQVQTIVSVNIGTFITKYVVLEVCP